MAARPPGLGCCSCGSLINLATASRIWSALGSRRTGLGLVIVNRETHEFTGRVMRNKIRERVKDPAVSAVSLRSPLEPAGG
jgi:hypothetical protein